MPDPFAAGALSATLALEPNGLGFDAAAG